MGLVLNATEKDEDVLPAALTLARKIARQSRVAVRSTVRSLRAQQERGLEQELWREGRF